MAIFRHVEQTNCLSQNTCQPECSNIQAAACDAWEQPGKTISVDGQTQGDYDKMIKDNFHYTQDNIADAYQAAAREGKPIVEVFGNWENNNSRHFVQDSLPQAKNGAGDAIYVYVDTTKATGALGQLASSLMAGGHNNEVSVVLPVKQGKDGQPEPDTYNFSWLGGDPSMFEFFQRSHQRCSSKDGFSQGPVQCQSSQAFG